MIFNYKRVSSFDQNTDRQLLNVPCDREYIDKCSGKNTQRPELQALLMNVRAGDIINVHSMDRLARNLRDLLTIVETLIEKEVTLNFIKENISFGKQTKNNYYQKAMLSLLGSVAELERNLILERQREGIAIAKAKGIYKNKKSRNHKLSPEKENYIYNLVNQNPKTNISKLARDFKVDRSTIYKILKDQTAVLALKPLN